MAEPLDDVLLASAPAPGSAAAPGPPGQLQQVPSILVTTDPDQGPKGPGHLSFPDATGVSKGAGPQRNRPQLTSQFWVMMKDLGQPPTIRSPGAGHQVGQGAPAQAVQEEGPGPQGRRSAEPPPGSGPPSIAPGCTGLQIPPAAGGENTRKPAVRPSLGLTPLTKHVRQMTHSPRPNPCPGPSPLSLVLPPHTLISFLGALTDSGEGTWAWSQGFWF